MKNIKELLKQEDIYLEDLSLDFLKRIQTLRRVKYSEEFIIDDDQWITLKEKLPFENINDVTLKKIIENLLVAKRLKHRYSDISLFDLLKNNTSYRFYPKSFYYLKF